MEQKTEPGFFSRVKEYLRNVDIKLVPVTEHNVDRLGPVLDALASESDMLPMTDTPNESAAEWVPETKGVWLFGDRDAGDFTQPEVAKGFVSIYKPEHLDKINDWLSAKSWRPYSPDTLIELSSFSKNFPDNAVKELAADTQTLGRVFIQDKDKPYGDIQAATIWVTHDPQNNTLDPFEASQMKELGAMALGSMKYDPKESVDSTCFLITKKHFLDTLIAPKK